MDASSARSMRESQVLMVRVTMVSSVKMRAVKLMATTWKQKKGRKI